MLVKLAALAVVLAPEVLAHGFISQWGKKGNLEKAQKADLKSSAFRAAPDNTGWIGSNFATNAAMTCGSSNTPFNTVAAPGGTFFSAAAQSAGRELAINAGDTVQVVVAGNKGEGWPHPKGIIQTYLGSCGGSCTNFDASKAKYFKIQEEIGGIQKTLRPAYDSSVDGNRYDIKIPADVEAGSYIMRFELIAFGQSSNAEGGQTQIYPFCGQLKVAGGGNNKRRLASRQAADTISFPGGYAGFNFKNENAAPGPNVVDGVVSGTVSASTDSNSGDDSGNSSSSSKQSAQSTKGKSASTSSSSSSSSGGLSLASSAPQCASMCLNAKISELGSLASSCDSSDASCMCGTNTFMTAFANCAKDNCNGDDATAVEALKNACGSGAAKKRDSRVRAQVQRKRATRQSATKATVKRSHAERMVKTKRRVAGHGAEVVGFKRH